MSWEEEITGKVGINHNADALAELYRTELYKETKTMNNDHDTWVCCGCTKEKDSYKDSANGCDACGGAFCDTCMSTDINYCEDCYEELEEIDEEGRR